MLILERLAHPRDRRRPTRATVLATGPTLLGSSSDVLRPRTEDLGATCRDACRCRCRCRCRPELPEQLAWGAALLDPEHPLAVLCGHEQACALIVWHNRLPTFEQVWFSCDRRERNSRSVGRG